MTGNPEIQIVDVILTKNYYGEYKHYSVVLDRMPVFVYSAGDWEPYCGYQRKQRRLTAHDSGLYCFRVERPGSSNAFAGRKFTISLDDGGTLVCDGQVWDEFHPNPPEPSIEVGINTIEGLQKCNGFFGGRISVAKLQAWLDGNTPSKNYRKYDPKHTIEWLDQRATDNTASWGERKVCAARARKLKKRGITIRMRGAQRTWYPWYERQKAIIERDLAIDEVAP